MSFDDKKERGEEIPIQKAKIGKFIEFQMAGGGDHYYSYRNCFDEKNNQSGIFQIDKTGQHQIEEGKIAIIITDDQGLQYIKFEDPHYECKDDECELL
jgi:hypothetical protein